MATGNWGCGAFQGDATLKSVTQWLAATRAGKALHYYPWDDGRVQTGFPALAGELVRRGVTVGAVARRLLEDLQPGDVYEQLAAL